MLKVLRYCYGAIDYGIGTSANFHKYEKEFRKLYKTSECHTQTECLTNEDIYTYTKGTTWGYIISLTLFWLLIPNAMADCTVCLDSDKTVVVVGESVFFTCRGSGISSVLWIVNGTKFTDSSLNGVTTGFIDSTSNLQDIGILNFHMAILEYNNMTIQCEVTLNSGSVLMSTVIPMLVQGKPPPVSATYYISQANITVSWDPVFTLDIPNVDPDVTYCVTIYNSTATFLSECTPTVYSISHELPNSFACGEFNLTVSALNVVGQTNSTNMPIINKELDISYVVVENLNGTKEEKLVRIVMRQYLCSNLTSLKIGEIPIPNWSMQGPDVLQFIMNDNERFEVTITNEMPPLNVTTEIKTFDVNETKAKMYSSNTVLLNTTFVAGSAAKGVLYTFVYIDDNNVIDFTRSVYYLESKLNAVKGTYHTVLDGTYRILSFDIESNYSIQSQGYAADVQQSFNVSGSTTAGVNNHSSMSCSTTNESNFKISVTCDCRRGSYYQTMFQMYSGSIQSVDYMIAKRTSCSESTLFYCEDNASCNIKAFPEDNYIGILSADGNSVTFATTVSTGEITTLPIGIIIGIMFLFFILIVDIAVLVVVCSVILKNSGSLKFKGKVNSSDIELEKCDEQTTEGRNIHQQRTLTKSTNDDDQLGGGSNNDVTAELESEPDLSSNQAVAYFTFQKKSPG